jgi:hypothetical protein
MHGRREEEKELEKKGGSRWMRDKMPKGSSRVQKVG